MRIASLDLGSNSFLCLIVESDGAGISKVLVDEVRVVRLSEGVLSTGLLGQAALVRAQAALQEFKDIIDKSGVDKIIAVTTAVARQAKNAKVFLEMVHGFGFPIQLISGSEEATITYLGAVSGLPKNQNVLVIDIGGGSTEIIFNKEYAKSFDFGVVRLKEKFSITYPISELQKNEMIKYIDSEITEFLQELCTKKIESIVAVAGTPTTLAAMELKGYDPQKVDGFIFSLDRLNYWFKELSCSTPQKIADQFQIDGGRADVIAVGVLILTRILSILKWSSLNVSIRGVRYGVALKVIGEQCL